MSYVSSSSFPLEQLKLRIDDKVPTVPDLMTCLRSGGITLATAYRPSARVHFLFVGLACYLVRIAFKGLSSQIRCTHIALGVAAGDQHGCGE
jgi:hypothetical protein